MSLPFLLPVVMAPCWLLNYNLTLKHHRQTTSLSTTSLLPVSLWIRYCCRCCPPLRQFRCLCDQQALISAMPEDISNWCSPQAVNGRYLFIAPLFYYSFLTIQCSLCHRCAFTHPCLFTHRAEGYCSQGSIQNDIKSRGASCPTASPLLCSFILHSLSLLIYMRPLVYSWTPASDPTNQFYGHIVHRKDMQRHSLMGVSRT